MASKFQVAKGSSPGPPDPDRETPKVYRYKDNQGQEHAVTLDSALKPKNEVPRETRFNRPLVKPPGRDKAIAHTRVTTYIKAIDDTSNIAKWKVRHALRGALMVPNLERSIKSKTDYALNGYAEYLHSLSGGNDSRMWGTILHAMTEDYDRNLFGVDQAAAWLYSWMDNPDSAFQKIQTESDGQQMLDLMAANRQAMTADFMAYANAIAKYRMEFAYIEPFSVHDGLSIAGTPDRIMKSIYLPDEDRTDTTRRVTDLKTGSVDLGALSISMQLGVYSEAQLYDWNTGERTQHGAETDFGYIFHLPLGQGEFHLYRINLEKGRARLRLCGEVRDARKLKAHHLMAEVGEPVGAEVEAPAVPAPVDAVKEALMRVTHLNDLKDVWADFQDQWKPEHTEIAKRIAQKLPPF